MDGVMKTETDREEAMFFFNRWAKGATVGSMRSTQPAQSTHPSKLLGPASTRESTRTLGPRLFFGGGNGAFEKS